MDRMDFSSMRKVGQIFCKQLFGVGSLMRGGAFSIKCKANFVKMEGKQNAQKDNEVLEKSFLPFLANNYQNDAIFRQDNAAIHTPKLTTKWLQDHNIATLSWLAKSPELNPIKNLRIILASRFTLIGDGLKIKKCFGAQLRKQYPMIRS